MLLGLSREGNPEKPIRLGGRLHDSAVGAIYYAQYKTEDSSSMVLKTIDLKEQNLWAVTKNNKRTTVRGLDSKNVLFLSNSKSEVKEWHTLWCKSDVYPERHNTIVSKICWTEDPIDREGATKRCQLNEYLNEAIIGLTLSKHLKLPHVVKTRDAWITDATGFILQDYGGTSLYKSMVDLTREEFQSIMLQTMITLSIAQDTLHFKHHDVHLENVFVGPLKDSDKTESGLALNGSKFWKYTLKDSNGNPFSIYVNHCQKLAKLGDFGLSAITDPESKVRYERADFSLLDSGEQEWGEWSGHLDNQKPYDLLTLLSKFFMEDETSLCKTSHAKWAREIYKAVQVLMPESECSSIGRPFRNRTGTLRIADLLQKLQLFQEFRTEQPDSVVVY